MDPNLIQEIKLLQEQVCGALDDSTRLRILYALDDQPRRVGELTEELDIPQTTLSRHLRILRSHFLVETHRQGQEVYYSLPDTRLIQSLDLLRGLLRDRLIAQAQVVQPETESDGAD